MTGLMRLYHSILRTCLLVDLAITVGTAIGELQNLLRATSNMRLRQTHERVESILGSVD